MIKIGDFAKIFDVSIKTIRFYEEKGTKPKHGEISGGKSPSFEDLSGFPRFSGVCSGKRRKALAFLTGKGI